MAKPQLSPFPFTSSAPPVMSSVSSPPFPFNWMPPMCSAGPAPAEHHVSPAATTVPLAAASVRSAAASSAIPASPAATAPASCVNAGIGFALPASGWCSAVSPSTTAAAARLHTEDSLRLFPSSPFAPSSAAPPVAAVSCASPAAYPWRAYPPSSLTGDAAPAVSAQASSSDSSIAAASGTGAASTPAAAGTAAAATAAAGTAAAATAAAALEASPEAPEEDPAAATLAATEATAAAVLAAYAKETPCWSPTDIVLRERFRNLHFAPMEARTPEELQLQRQLLMQQQVQRFFSEGCLPRACIMAAGGGVLGVLFGSFFFTMKPVDVDTAVPFREQLKQQYRSFLPDVMQSAKNFAKLGFLFSLTECFIQKARAVDDINNAIYAGCISGAILAHKGGPWGMAAGCAGFGAFSGVMEKLQRSGFFSH